MAEREVLLMDPTWVSRAYELMQVVEAAPNDCAAHLKAAQLMREAEAGAFSPATIAEGTPVAEVTPPQPSVIAVVAMMETTIDRLIDLRRRVAKVENAIETPIDCFALDTAVELLQRTMAGIQEGSR